VLEETDRLFECEYCRVKSYLQPRGYFRYLFPDNAPQNRDLVFFPYWRFKGLLFSCLPDGIRHRFVDVSHQAIDNVLFPLSVGLRSQALKLRFVSPDAAGRFLKPTLGPQQVLNRCIERFSVDLPPPILAQAHIGDSTSLIYSPFYTDKKLFDAILNRAVSGNGREDVDLSGLDSAKARGAIHFLPTLCPHCGWDLTGRKDSLLLECKNCAAIYKPHHQGFKKLSVVHVPHKGDDLIYLPFWRIKADVTGIELNSYADLIHAANLPRVPQSGMESIPFHFWSLAFKVRPQHFLRIGQAVTLSQPGGPLEPNLPPSRRHPINLPLKEGVESLKMLLAGFLRPRQTLSARLPQIKVTPRSYILVYLPFHERHHELVHPTLSLAINKNMLHHARNL